MAANPHPDAHPDLKAKLDPNKQYTSAELRELEDAEGLHLSPLAPTATPAARDPNLDPNVKTTATVGTAGPARTETTREASVKAGVIKEPPQDAPRSTVNSAPPLTDSAPDDEAIRKANAKKASAKPK